MNKKNLSENLKYLCNPRQMVLIKDNPKTPNFLPTESVRVNLQFKCPVLQPSLIPKREVQKIDLDDIETKNKKDRIITI